MLSKITGDQYGISKNVNPVIVKIPATAEGGNGALDWVDGVRKAYEDYRVRLGNGIDEKIGAIISLSFHIPAASLDPPAATYFRILLQSLVSVGVLPITGAGNGADTVYMSPCPELALTNRLTSPSPATLPCSQVEPLRMFPNSWLSEIATTTVLDMSGYVFHELFMNWFDELYHLVRAKWPRTSPSTHQARSQLQLPQTRMTARGRGLAQAHQIAS